MALYEGLVVEHYVGDSLIAKEEQVAPPERVREIERMVMLQTVDRHWTEHIDIMDQKRLLSLQQGAGMPDSPAGFPEKVRFV